jgi:glycosyltransferase involved in cell wall biosynthesis
VGTRSHVSAPLISVVLATRNRAAALEETLAVLARVTVLESWNAELIIVNNGSSDDTAAVATRGRIGDSPAGVITEPVRGVSRARNRGAKHAGGSVLLFLDDDVHPPQTWLRGLATPIVEGAAAATVTQFRLGRDRPWLTNVDRARLMSELSIDPTHPFLVGGSMGIRGDLFRDLGGFDEELGPGALGPGGEDLLLTYRVQARREAIAFVQDVEVIHLPDPDKLLRQALEARLVAEAASEAWLAYHWFGRSDRRAAAKARVLAAMSRLPLGGAKQNYAVRAAWHAQMDVEQRRQRKYSSEPG